MVPMEQVVTVFALILLLSVTIMIVQGIRYNSTVKDLTNEINGLLESRSVLRSAADGMFQIIGERDEIISDLNSAMQETTKEPPTHVRVQVSDSDIWHVFTDLYVAFIFVHTAQTTFPELGFKVEAVKGIKVAGIEL